MKKYTDLTGQKYGKLTVAEHLGMVNGRRRYKCICDCGGSKTALHSKLVEGSTRSCGCLVSESKKIFNVYEIHKDFITGITKMGEKFIFDKEDYDKVKGHYWVVDKNGYIKTKLSMRGRGKQITTSIQRIIMTPQKNEVVDHINHNTLDNRKINLRICTGQQNSWNRKCKGYYFDNRTKTYRALIMHNGEKIHLGYFSTEAEAKSAREKAAIKYYGEYRYKEVV
ncbi:MAG: HNH endonuclease [Treponema sp.]|jgi:hypothetical protein|nr:HNH endonuclease [Treponema sp.]